MKHSIIIARLKAAKDDFVADTEGTVSAEAAIVFPFIMWAFLSLFVFFDAYQQKALNLKAANTIADMLSRETENINSNYIDNAQELFEIMTRNNSSTAIRISVVKWADRHDNYRVVWSKTRGNGHTTLSHSDITDWEAKLPIVPNQERIVLVETWSQYRAPFRVGMPDTDVATFVFTRLRFGAQLKYSNS